MSDGGVSNEWDPKPRSAPKPVVPDMGTRPTPPRPRQQPEPGRPAPQAPPPPSPSAAEPRTRAWLLAATVGALVVLLVLVLSGRNDTGSNDVCDFTRSEADMAEAGRLFNLLMQDPRQEVIVTRDVKTNSCAVKPKLTKAQPDGKGG